MTPSAEQNSSTPAPDPQATKVDERRRYVVHVCPECGEHCPTPEYDPEHGSVYGHYHDPPADWPEGEPDPWFDAVAVEVVPASLVASRDEEIERLRAELIACDGERLVEVDRRADLEVEGARLKRERDEAQAEVARLQARVKELEEEGLRLAGLLDPAAAEGARKERERVERVLRELLPDRIGNLLLDELLATVLSEEAR